MLKEDIVERICNARVVYDEIFSCGWFEAMEKVGLDCFRRPASVLDVNSWTMQDEKLGYELPVDLQAVRLVLENPRSSGVLEDDDDDDDCQAFLRGNTEYD